jgi:hypothetical protein
MQGGNLIAQPVGIYDHASTSHLAWFWHIQHPRLRSLTARIVPLWRISR